MFSKIVLDIKSLRIQGAEHVARAALTAMEERVQHSRARTPRDFFHDLSSARKILESTRPTEPCMRNALRFVFSSPLLVQPSSRASVAELRHIVRTRIARVQFHFHHAAAQIAAMGARKIRDGMVIYSHCHSSTVAAILKQAHAQGMRFTVHQTESRPLYQGRILAAELARAGIPVVHYVDAAAHLALKRADLALFGADAITTTKIYNKIGTGLVCEVAHHYEVPVYICTNSWKFDSKSTFGFEEEVEQRYAREVWPRHPRGVQIHNAAFEIVYPELAAGILSELGVYPHAVFVEKVQQAYPELF